jgi:hypothetical protein
VGLQVLFYNHSTLIVLCIGQVYPVPCLVLIHLKHYRLILLMPSCIHPIQSIQEKVTSDRTDDYFSLDVLTPMEGVSLRMRT